MGFVQSYPGVARRWLPPIGRSLPHFFLLTILALSLLLLPGCQSGFARYSGTKRIKILHEAVLDYNKLLRWQEWEKASGFVRSEEQQAFKEGFYRIEEEFRITGYEIRDTDVDEVESKSADIIVLFRYYLLPSITEKKTRVTQRWIWSEEENRWAVDEPLDFLEPILKPTASRKRVRTVSTHRIEHGK